MFTGANDTSLKQLLSAKLNATALDKTVVNTNTLTDPIIVGELNYKETASDTDGRNLISEISNKVNLNAPNFSTSLQLNSTNVLLQPGEFNGTLQVYVELKAPEQTPPDLSGMISKPGDYADNNLDTYIQRKALKNPTFIVEDIAGAEERITISDIVTAYAPPPANLTGYADEVFENLQKYTPSWILNNTFDDYADRDEVLVVHSNEN